MVLINNSIFHIISAMRKIILNCAVSLDGFIEGPKGEIDWCFLDQDYGMTDFMNRIDAIFFGRKSYELVLRMDKNPYPDKIKYVFSNSLKSAEGNTKIISEPVEETVKNITHEAGKDIWLFGGSILITSLLNAGFVDEIQLSVHPILLGKGMPLCGEIKKRIHFKLIDTKTYSTGLVQLIYQRERGD